MKIHQIEVFKEPRVEVDPRYGLVTRFDEAMKQGSTTSIVHKGETYVRGADGTFDVPDELGTFQLRSADWFAGPSPFVEKTAVKSRSKTAVKS